MSSFCNVRNVCNVCNVSCYHKVIRFKFKFQDLLRKVEPAITKKSIHLRQPINAGERHGVTMWFLATGEAYRSLGFQFRIHYTKIGEFIPEVLDAIYNALKEDYFKMPSTQEEWMELATETERKWNFPNAIAAVDGKHIAIKKPALSGSSYYNYKGFDSIVLLVFVDHDYKILYADVGAQGRISDGGVYRDCSFNSCLPKGELNLPPPRPLPKPQDPKWEPLGEEEETNVPFVFVGDNAPRRSG